MLKGQIKDRLPFLYNPLRLFWGFFIAAVVCRRIIFDRKIIDHVRWCKWGESQLDLLYANENSHRNPLRLDMINKRKIRPSVLLDYYHYNPTLQNQDGIIRVYWRVSDFSFINYQDNLGRWHGTNIGELANFERIATGVLGTYSESNFGILSQERVLPEINFINRIEVSKATGNGSAELYIEDPRAHEGTGRYITAHARFGKVSKNFYRMIVIDLATNSGIIVPGSDPNKWEKNWVVIQELENSLLFLNQSKPAIIDKVNIKTGVSERLEIQEDESRQNFANLNGGSPLVRIDSKHLLRVARLTFPIYPIGVTRISVLVLHDLEFKEVARSKPFIFNKLGVEICNGLLVKDGVVYFSWGEDDLEMYVGWCTKEKLMYWFNENLQS